MTILLFPGRHLLQTVFQEQYLRAVVQSPLDRLTFLHGSPLQITEPIDTIVFAVTSANHQFTRYNPIPFYVRAIGIDRFASDFAQDLRIGYRIFGIPHYAPSPRFAAILLKEITEQTEGNLDLTPTNTIVLTSTAPLARMFQTLGYAILPAEATESPQPLTPQKLLSAIMTQGENWREHPQLRSELSPVTYALWRDFPEMTRRIFRLWHDPLLTDEGSLTTSRNYSTYAQAMSNEAIIDLKYRDIASHIIPGRIVDEGCADGALLVRVANDFPDSDLIGIEITGELLSRCLERQRAGEFGEAFVHFHQRNITTPIFQPATIHTTICNSTLHELWSYNEGAATISIYLHEKYRQLAPGGHLLIRDVVGPQYPDQTVYLWLTDQDGVALQPNAKDQDVATLSTYARFLRFAQDFLPQHRPHAQSPLVPFTVETLDNRNYIITSMRLAVEFISKKDYTENWQSEMHEEFAFWNFDDWKTALHQVGFAVQQDPDYIESASHVYTNQWIVEHRWQNQVALFLREGNALLPLPFPPTNVLLIAKKPQIPTVIKSVPSLDSYVDASSDLPWIVEL
jgi:trans-aconitate methyltransferase